VVKEMGSLKHSEKDRLIQFSESCESGIFSFYTSVDSVYYPCSFTEGEKGWEKGIDMLGASDFIKDIWYHPKNVEWRDCLVKSCENGCRKCLTFPEINV